MGGVVTMAVTEGVLMYEIASEDKLYEARLRLKQKQHWNFIVNYE